MGSTDTMTVSEVSTNVTLDTVSSHTCSSGSQTASCRAICGSLASFDTSSVLNTEGNSYERYTSKASILLIICNINIMQYMHTNLILLCIEYIGLEVFGRILIILFGSFYTNLVIALK